MMVTSTIHPFWRKWIRRLLIAAGIGVLAYALWVLFVLIAGRVSFPSSETLVYWYLDEVMNGTATELDTPYLRCGNRDIEADRSLLSGGEVRNVQIQTTMGTGSSETLELIAVTLEYRPAGAADWQTRTLNHGIYTDFEFLQPRRLWCGP
ncbi:MAG: hypothetical protein U0670_21810 [Anaerolineae bacterium]